LKNTQPTTNHHLTHVTTRCFVSVYDMAARFRFLLDDFIDKRVLLGGDEPSVFEVTNKHVFLAPTDAKQPVTRRDCKRVDLLGAVRGHVRALMNGEKGHKKAHLADNVKQIVKEDLRREARLRASQALCDDH
jgi:hypothetical protein